MAKEKQYKTTPKHFELFKKECLKWINVLGLNDWEMDYTHKDIKSEWRSWVAYDVINRIATINLEISWDDNKPTDNLVKRMAFHEVLHLLFADISALVNSRTVTQKMLDMCEHKLIRILENILWDRMK